MTDEKGLTLSLVGGTLALPSRPVQNSQGIDKADLKKLYFALDPVSVDIVIFGNKFLGTHHLQS